jgi:hypothetical protein
MSYWQSTKFEEYCHSQTHATVIQLRFVGFLFFVSNEIPFFSNYKHQETCDQKHRRRHKSNIGHV